ncbi:MAG: TIR domain-containing protein [Hyphomonadaceae bacterium]
MAREAIFIGYRRDDTADVAGRIYDALETRFGKERLFKDVDNIPPGVDFGKYIKGILPRCRVALILIGPNWINARDANGRRRLDDPNDWVRVEAETALAINGLQVVPVLINGAQMPSSTDLPLSLRPLVHRNAAIIRRDPDFRDDVARLANALRASVRTGFLDLGSLGEERSTSRRRGGLGGLLLGALVGATAISGLLYFSDWRPNWMASPPAQTHTQEQIAETDAASAPTTPANDAKVDPPPAARTANGSTDQPNSAPAGAPPTRAPEPERSTALVSGTIWRGSRSISTTSARFCSDWGATVDEAIQFRSDGTVSDSMMGAGTYAQHGDRVVVTHRWGGMDLRITSNSIRGTFRFNMSGAADADCEGTVELRPSQS